MTDAVVADRDARRAVGLGLFTIGCNAVEGVIAVLEGREAWEGELEGDG